MATFRNNRQAGSFLFSMSLVVILIATNAWKKSAPGVHTKPDAIPESISS